MNSSISHVANINAPLNSIESSDFNIYGRNINFGVSTGIDEINDSIIIGAIGYGIIFLMIKISFLFIQEILF